MPNFFSTYSEKTARKAAIICTPSSSCPITSTFSSRQHRTSPSKKPCNSSKEDSPSASNPNAISGRADTQNVASKTHRITQHTRHTSTKIPSSLISAHEPKTSRILQPQGSFKSIPYQHI